jgi:Spy/CpxP family protein refolding chaperone
LRRIAISVLAVSCAVFTASDPGVAESQGSASNRTPIDIVLKAVREDLQSSRADIMAKNLTLTAEQAAKFWPMFQKYQQAQNAIMDEQLQIVQRYVETYATMDDASALALLNAHFDRDAHMHTLRQEWLKEFRTILPTRVAVRAMQIDRRLGLMSQVELSARVPLLHCAAAAETRTARPAPSSSPPARSRRCAGRERSGRGRRCRRRHRRRRWS